MSEQQEPVTRSQLSMDDHELLMRLLKSQKTAMLHRRIIAYVEVLMLVLMVAMILIIGPRLIQLMDQMAATLERINQLTDAAEPTLNNLSKLDFESLNTSISALSDAVDKFSQFTSKLSGLGGLFR